MAKSRGRWIAAAVFAGFVLILAGPAWLVWSALRSRDWDERTLRIRFESVGYENAGFVFEYLDWNPTFRSLRLGRDDTEVRALQPTGSLTVGFAQ